MLGLVLDCGNVSGESCKCSTNVRGGNGTCCGAWDIVSGESAGVFDEV